MDLDLLLIVGLFLFVLSAPAVLGAYADRRRPRLSGLLFLIGVGLAAYAWFTHPEGYEIARIPDLFFDVLAKYFW